MPLVTDPAAQALQECATCIQPPLRPDHTYTASHGIRSQIIPGHARNLSHPDAEDGAEVYQKQDN